MRTQALAALILIAWSLCATAAEPAWISPGEHKELPASSEFDDFYGRLGVLNALGPIRTEGHPFFTAIGSNGRACVSCHQPAYAMSVSAAGLRERWRATQGKDPVFAAIDGSNCPHLPQELTGSHALLLDRGLFRVMLPWPPKDAKGVAIEPEFDIEVVRDPTGCNLHPLYGMKSKSPTISVYRRPRPAANLKYVLATASARPFMPSNGEAATLDAGSPVSMNLMADARWPTLAAQANDAMQVHLQMPGALSEQQLRQLILFESQVYVAQVGGRENTSLLTPDAPPSVGPASLAKGKPGVDGDVLSAPAFGSFAKWKSVNESDAQSALRVSVARGHDIFFTRPLWIRDAMHVNTTLGNPAKRTCSTCHAMQMSGMSLQGGWIDVGTTNAPWASESPELPLFKITCKQSQPPHAFLGRVIYTQDPGRALISGRCNDVGAIVVQQLRGLGARPPYFSNGSAATLREVVDFYDRRFNIRLSEQDKQDLVNFLGAL